MLEIKNKYNKKIKKMGWISYIKFLGLNFTTFKKSIKNGLDYTNIFYGLELTIVGVGKNHPDVYKYRKIKNLSLKF